MAATVPKPPPTAPALAAPEVVAAPEATAAPDADAAPEALHEATPEYSEPSLISIARQTFIFARPSFKAQKVGYLRV